MDGPRKTHIEYRIVEWDYSHGPQPDVDIYPTTFQNKNVALDIMESRSGISKFVFLEERELTDWHRTGNQVD